MKLVGTCRERDAERQLAVLMIRLAAVAIWCCTGNCSAASATSFIINNNNNRADSALSLFFLLQSPLTRLQCIEQGGQLAGGISDISLLHNHITSHRHGVSVDCARHGFAVDETVIVVVVAGSGGDKDDVDDAVSASVDLIQMN